ncbi:RNA 3'-terminal phosphate cyclase [Archaeoglobus sp.]
MIEIDGSFGEGGGQILRTAVALSCVTGKAVRIKNIRANRPKPGLAAQHLKGIEAAKIISNAEVEGLRLGSTEVVFRPRSVRGGEFRIDIGTAGSVTLIFQTVLLPLLFADRESRLTVSGGTDVAWAPPVDYFKNVTLRALREMSVECELKVLKRGYYPKGGGVVKLEAKPSEMRGVIFEKLDEMVKGISHCQNLPEHVAVRQANSARGFLEERGVKAKIKTEVLKGLSTGSGIVLWSGYKGGSALGERGKRAEIVGLEAAENLYRELKSEAAFDAHLADQVMPFAAMAKGSTEYTTSEVTMHQKSNAYVINSFLGEVVRFEGNKIKIK